MEPMYTYIRTRIAVRNTVYVLHSSSIELVWKFCLVQQKKLYVDKLVMLVLNYALLIIIVVSIQYNYTDRMYGYVMSHRAQL